MSDSDDLSDGGRGAAVATSAAATRDGGSGSGGGGRRDAFADLSDDDDSEPRTPLARANDRGRESPRALRKEAGVNVDDYGDGDEDREGEEAGSENEDEEDEDGDEDGRDDGDDVSHADDRVRKKSEDNYGSDEDEDDEREDGRRGASVAPAPRRPAVPRGPAHERTMVMQPTADGPLTLLKLPPAMEAPLRPCDPRRDELPPGAAVPLMYRLKPGVKRVDVQRAVDAHGVHRAIPMLAESNTRLVTWSDGSRTLMVGDEHFAVTADRIPPISLYVFRKGTEMQSYYGRVGEICSAQPSTVDRKRGLAALGLGPGGAGGLASKAVRTMGRLYDGGAEKEEREALATFQAKQREAARLQSKRRRLAERQVRPERRMTKADLESDAEESDDDEQDALREDRRREAERASRLRESQRGPALLDRVAPPQRRKIGARRVLGIDDDDDDGDDDD